MEKIPLLCVVGPTASGKTKLAVHLAKRFGGEVISADSMQIYRYMDIGTAKPTMEERQGVAHHLIDIADPGQSFSVAEYVALAHQAATEIAARGNLPIVAGGTGLYVDSFVQNLSFEEIPGDPKLREELEERARNGEWSVLLKELQSFDPELANALHPNHYGRLARAIEVYRVSGVTMSEYQRRSRQNPSPYRPYFIGLSCRDRAVLYRRIDDRVQQMLKAGLLKELEHLKQKGYGRTASQAIGYKEFFDYLEGRETLDQAVERVQRESRRYAKRQLTWFRRNAQIHWLYSDDYAAFEELMEEASVQAARFLREGGTVDGRDIQ